MEYLELSNNFTTQSKFHAEPDTSLPQLLIERVDTNLSFLYTTSSLHISLLTTEVFFRNILQ